MPRCPRGRRKIKMAKMENESNLQVTFSKRRTSLFNKASELSTLCDAEVGVIVFSPSDKVYSFGHPSLEAVTHRFLTGNPPAPTDFSGTEVFIQAQRNASLFQLNKQLSRVLTELDEARKEGEEIDKMTKARLQVKYNWWEKPHDELTKGQMIQLKGMMEVLKRKVAMETEERSKTNPPNQNFTGSSSSNPVRVGMSMAIESGSSYNENLVMTAPLSAFYEQYPTVKPPASGGSVFDGNMMMNYNRLAAGSGFDGNRMMAMQPRLMNPPHVAGPPPSPPPAAPASWGLNNFGYGSGFQG